MSKSTTEVKIEAPAGADELARTICAAHDNRPDELLEIFHDLQHDLGYVPEETLPVIANALNRSRAEVYGVLTFYHEFRRTPGGRHNIKICRAEACQAMHTQNLCRHAEDKLKVKFGETTAERVKVRPAMIPVFLHLSIVLMLGLWIPPFLADWYRQAARLIG